MKPGEHLFRRVVAIAIALLGFVVGCAAPQAVSRPKLHVVSLANQRAGGHVDVSVADPHGEHIVVLISHWPVAWKLSIAEATTVRAVVLSSSNKRHQNSTVSGVPAELTSFDDRLPKPIRRYEYGGRYGGIVLAENFVNLREKLLARYGVEVTTFQSGVSQTSFMIR